MPVAMSPRTARNVAWIEKHCRVPEGKHRGKPLVVADFMREDFEAIWGNPFITRTAIISRARKNAKTVQMALFFLLYLLGPEIVPGAQLYSAANNQEQASVLFKLMCKIIRQNPRMAAALKIYEDSKIVNVAKEITYEALTSDAATAHGRSPLLVCMDELGQWKGATSDLYDALMTGSSQYDEPLMLIISTQAPYDHSLLSQLIDGALASEKLPDGHEDKDPHTIVRLNVAPMDLDPFSPEALEAANPAYSIFMNQGEIAKIIKKAKNNPSWLPVFRNLHLNQRVATASPFVSVDVWKANGAEPAENWRGHPVWGAFDLSIAKDLTAFVMVCEIAGVRHTRTLAWLPEDGIDQKAKDDKVPWDTWAEQGHLRLTPGPTVDYAIVAQDIFDACRGLDLRGIAYDKYRFATLRPWLLRAGFTEEQLEGEKALFHCHGQGFGDMAGALNVLEQDLLANRLAHGNHPVLSVCANNATVLIDSNGNRRFSKKGKMSADRIDAMVALAMAVNIANAQLAPPPPRRSYLSRPGARVIAA